MVYSINIDWSEELNGENFEKWENLGRQFAESSCSHKSEESGDNTLMEYGGYCEECGFSEDSQQPMMNYYYPLEFEPSEEAIKNTIENTNLTIMYNNETNSHFLVLTGGGMDLSQDIALAYFYCQRWIPGELLRNVSIQKGLSVSGENWELLREEMIYQSKFMENVGSQLKKQWEATDK